MDNIERCPCCNGKPKQWFNHQKGHILKTKPKNLDEGFVYFELLCIHCFGNGLSIKGKDIEGYNLYRQMGGELLYQA